ncbi:hypothetical protein [Deinococcus altitudinis]|uniref:hypothetical protein n=1 Tax=Deinococcus altitudinis TaxID=468914 RepID=UPI0038915AC4
MKRIVYLLALPILMLGLALAQVAPPLPDQLAPYAPLITVGIGLFSTLLVYPLTAIAKRLGRTQGPTTVIISGVLSLLVSAGFTLWQAAATHTGAEFWPALLSAAMAFATSNGVYIGQVFAATKGAAQSLPTVIVTAAPQVLHPVGTPGTEPLHNLEGEVIGAVKPLT